MSTARLTAQLERLTNGTRPARAELRITSSSVKDVDGKILHAGGYQVIQFNRGKISIDLLATNTPNTDPETWQYGFEVRWAGGSLPKFYAELTEDTDLADIQPMDPADPIYVPTDIPMDRVTGLDEALEVLTDAVDTKADQADLTSGLATKVNSSTYNAGLATKANKDLPAYAPSNSTGQYDQRRNAYNVKPSNTRRIRAALGSAAVSPWLPSSGLARIAVLGDSKSDQFNGSDISNGGFDTSFTKWPWVLRKRLAAALGVPVGGTGFVKCYHAGIYDPRWSFTGTWANLVAGPYSYTLTNGDTATFSTSLTGETGSIVEVIYNDYSTAPWTLSVDGATSGDLFVEVTNTNTNAPKKITLDTGNDATHTVTITNGAAYSFIIGAEIRKASGVVVDNYALNGGWAAMYAAGQPVGDLARFHNPDPDLVILSVGPNDLGTHPGAQNKTVAQALTDAANTLALYPESDILIVAEDRTTSVPEVKWNEYVAGLYALADTIDAPLLDLTDRYGPVDDPAHADLLIDGTHHSAAGDADWAAAFMGVLL